MKEALCPSFNHRSALLGSRLRVKTNGGRLFQLSRMFKLRRFYYNPLKNKLTQTVAQLFLGVLTKQTRGRLKICYDSKVVKHVQV